MNKQQFREYLEQYTKKDTPLASPGFLLAWHLYQKGEREGYKRGIKIGRKEGYKKGYSHAAYMNPINGPK